MKNPTLNHVTPGKHTSVPGFECRDAPVRNRVETKQAVLWKARCSFAQIFFCLQKNCSRKKRDEHIFLNVDIQGTGMGHNEIQPIEMRISTAHNKPLINISPDRNQSNHQQQS